MSWLIIPTAAWNIGEFCVYFLDVNRAGDWKTTIHHIELRFIARCLSLPLFAFGVPHNWLRMKVIRQILKMSVRIRKVFVLSVFLFSQILYLLCTDVLGVPSRFINLAVRNGNVYCTFCKGCVGSQASPENDIKLRRFKLVRVEPRFMFSICVGTTHDRHGNLVPHEHMTQVATVDSNPESPTVPIELRSIRNGLFLNEVCFYARYILNSPPLTAADQNQLALRLQASYIADHATAGRLARENAVKKRKQMQTYARASKASQVEPPEKRKANQNDCVQNDTSFEQYLRDQPSTSSNIYDRSVEEEIIARQRLNLRGAITSEHSYSQCVCYEFFVRFVLSVITIIDSYHSLLPGNCRTGNATNKRRNCGQLSGCFIEFNRKKRGTHNCVLRIPVNSGA